MCRRFPGKVGPAPNLPSLLASNPEGRGDLLGSIRIAADHLAAVAGGELLVNLGLSRTD